MKFRDVFKERVVNVSNGLTVFRILLLPPFLYLGLRYQKEPGNPSLYYPLAFVIFLSMVSDFLDGFLARLLKQETMLGRYLDPLADKLTSLSALALLTFYYGFPLWIFIFICIREAVNVWAGSYLYFKKNVQGRPNIWGKISITMTAFAVLWYMSLPYLRFRNPELAGWITHPEYLAWALAFVIAIGIVDYWKRYWRLAFGDRQKDSARSK